MKKRRLFLVLGALAAYFLLLCLLIAAETSAPEDAGASITSLGQALWYSLVTMTTVGYGDAYPVTFFGRIIGVLFLLLSAGALTAFISLGVGWVTGSGLPKLRIRRAGKRPIYIFLHADSAAMALADNILAETPDALCLFGEAGAISPADRNRIGVDMSPDRLLSLLPKGASRPTMVFTGSDAEEQLTRMGIPENADVICQTTRVPENLRPDVKFFDRSELCASMYWQRFPLEKKEKRKLLSQTLGDLVAFHYEKCGEYKKILDEAKYYENIMHAHDALVHAIEMTENQFADFINEYQRQMQVHAQLKNTNKQINQLHKVADNQLNQQTEQLNNTLNQLGDLFNKI